ncbi:MAG: 1-acyl-sn-glycerol-3-phosphate acyltransferase [Desulfobacterales bacterium]|nr:1-acyl-sn-glycerol-3-phosphate acyltransferase [Desulfobacterales bacterium]
MVTRTGNPVHRVAQGVEPFDPGGQRGPGGRFRPGADRPGAAAYIFMSNHQSNFDIPVLLGHLPVQFRWLAKAELFNIPVFGRAMRGAGYISIDRADREAAFESLRQAAETIRNGVSIMIFPEGTRSLDGTLQALQERRFRAWRSMPGCRSCPWRSAGTHAIMPKRRWLIRPRDGRRWRSASRSPPSACACDTKEALMERVRDGHSQRLLGGVD